MKLLCATGAYGRYYNFDHIVLYESNGEYWIYLEAGNYDYDVMFIRDNIGFLHFHDIDGVVADMIAHMFE